MDLHNASLADEHIMTILVPMLQDESNGVGELVLDENYIGDLGAQALVEGLMKNRELHTLSLQRTGMGPECRIGHLLKRNHYLTELNVARNDLGVKGELYTRKSCFPPI